MPIDPANRARFGAGFAEPPLMAIGDSLYNGVRSLTINRELAALSVPAMVANAMAVPFVIPDYPRPIVGDFEEFIRQGINLDRLRALAADNGDAWLASGPAWSSKLFFDNIAIAGAEVGDLIEDTSANYKAQVPALIASLRHGGPLGDLAKLHYALNASYLLNPSGEPDLDDCTPLEIVAFRRPKRLLVSIGANEGLFMACFMGIYDERTIAQIDKLPDLLETLATTMAALFAKNTIPAIYFNKLIKPSTVANVMPRVDQLPPGCGKYYADYVGRLSGGVNQISAKRMAAFDKQIDAINTDIEKRVRRILGKTRKIGFADAYSMAALHDHKHGCETPADQVRVDHHGRDFRLSNLPLSVVPLFGGFKAGGLFGLDNMHPTCAGYALLANEMLRAIKATEPTTQFTPVDIQAAYDRDSLMHSLPNDWDFVTLLVGLLGSLGFLGSGASVF